MTRDQALAFFETILSNKNCVTHLKAAAGIYDVPANVECFSSKEQVTRDRCEILLKYVSEATGILVGTGQKFRDQDTAVDPQWAEVQPEGNRP